VEYFNKIRLQNSQELAEEFRFLQSLTTRPVKETITGPATLSDWALIRSDRYYKDRRAFRMDLAKALRKQIEAVVQEGVRVLQVDEPALTTKPKNLGIDLEAIHETIRGLVSDVYIILHICYSDMEALDQAFPYILELPFHQIHMEMANRGYSLMRLIEKHGFGDKDIGLGVIDVHTDRIETVEEIMRGVELARRYFEPNQIWLTPDCGLKERSEEIAKEKLRRMVRAAELCRKDWHLKIRTK
jgi:5-methyltetrahydropteroyltriglutamate--homocysteine methyltransferase